MSVDIDTGTVPGIAIGIKENNIEIIGVHMVLLMLSIAPPTPLDLAFTIEPAQNKTCWVKCVLQP